MSRSSGTVRVACLLVVGLFAGMAQAAPPVEEIIASAAAARYKRGPVRFEVVSERVPDGVSRVTLDGKRWRLDEITPGGVRVLARATTRPGSWAAATRAIVGKAAEGDRSNLATMSSYVSDGDALFQLVFSNQTGELFSVDRVREEPRQVEAWRGRLGCPSLGGPLSGNQSVFDLLAARTGALKCEERLPGVYDISFDMKSGHLVFTVDSNREYVIVAAKRVYKDGPEVSQRERERFSKTERGRDRKKVYQEWQEATLSEVEVVRVGGHWYPTAERMSWRVKWPGGGGAEVQESATTVRYRDFRVLSPAEADAATRVRPSDGMPGADFDVLENPQGVWRGGELVAGVPVFFSEEGGRVVVREQRPSSRSSLRGGAMSAVVVVEREEREWVPAAAFVVAGLGLAAAWVIRVRRGGRAKGGER